MYVYMMSKLTGIIEIGSKRVPKGINNSFSSFFENEYVFVSVHSLQAITMM